MYYSGSDGTNSRILSAISSDGLTWTKESGIRIDGGGNPDVIELPDRTYRMYYESSNQILSATSTDGLTWIKESGIRLTTGGTYDSGQVHDPNVIKLSDGTYRMYYDGSVIGSSAYRILSATSPDGLAWTKESGIRINYGDNLLDPSQVLTPEIIKLPDGTYRMYYASLDAPNRPHGYYIRSAVSSDELIWTKEDGIRLNYGDTYDTIAAYDPSIIELSDGRYRMYYAGGAGDPYNPDAAVYRILSAVNAPAPTTPTPTTPAPTIPTPTTPAPTTPAPTTPAPTTPVLTTTVPPTTVPPMPVDTSPPSISISKQIVDFNKNGQLDEGEKLVITYGANDESGVKSIRVLLDGNLIELRNNEGIYSVTTDSLSAGSHSIVVEAIDSNGNKKSEEMKFTVARAGPSVYFPKSRYEVNAGDDFDVVLSAVNPIGNPKMDALLILKPPGNGISTYESDCKGFSGQCTGRFEIEPGDSVRSVSTRMRADRAGEYQVDAEVYYQFENGQRSPTRYETLVVVVKPKSQVMNPANTQPLSTPKAPGFGVIIGIIGLLLITLLKKRR